MVMRDVSQRRDKHGNIGGKEVKEGTNHNITPLLDSEVP